MKKTLFALCILFASIFTITSCDPATSTSEGSVQGIYTVDRNFLRPEMNDTAYFSVKNIKEHGLKDGDRAYITLGYEIDNYFGPSSAVYYIKSVEAIIPVYGLTAKEEIDATVYSAPVTGLQEILINSDGLLSAMWLFKKYQNINIVYKSNGTEGNFKLSPAGLSGDTVCFTLNAKIEQGNKRMGKLLSFDVSSVASMLTAEEAKKLATFDSIYTKIAIPCDINGTIETKYPFGGKYKNNLK